MNKLNNTDGNTYKIKLTQRENDVLKLILEGKNNREIAKILFITHHTVKAHVSSILKKFGVKTRVEAAIAAVKTNIVTPRRD